VTDRGEIDGVMDAARVESTTERLELVLSQPEIIAWLRLSEPEVVAWARAAQGRGRRGGEGGHAGAFSPAPIRALEPHHGPPVVAKPLRHGDVRTVLGVFERLSERSRRLRFNGPKPCLSLPELRQLASIDRTRHALVAYVEDDPEPAAIARLVRDGETAELAFAVADEYHRRGIGSALTAELIADARKAGVTEVTALVSRDNGAAVALLRRVLHAVSLSFEGAELSVRAAIA